MRLPPVSGEGAPKAGLPVPVPTAWVPCVCVSVCACACPAAHSCTCALCWVWVGAHREWALVTRLAGCVFCPRDPVRALDCHCRPCVGARSGHGTWWPPPAPGAPFLGLGSSFQQHPRGRRGWVGRPVHSPGHPSRGRAHLGHALSGPCPHWWGTLRRDHSRGRSKWQEQGQSWPCPPPTGAFQGLACPVTPQPCPGAALPPPFPSAAHGVLRAAPLHSPTQSVQTGPSHPVPCPPSPAHSCDCPGHPGHPGRVQQLAWTGAAGGLWGGGQLHSGG